MRRKQGYRLFRPRYDWKMIRDQVGESAFGNAYLEIEVKNPRTHIKQEKALYTDYEIELKTNHPAFPLFHSQVRRRYSEFVWLRNKLGLDDVVMISVPQLPGKQLIGRFKDSFLKQRQEGLERFLNRLVSITAFANNPALLIFLQTNLNNKQMDYYLKTRTPGGIRSLILRVHDKKLKATKEDYKPRSKTYSAEYPPVERPQTVKLPSSGRSWSSFHSGTSFGFGFRGHATDSRPRHTGRVRSISCMASPSGLLTLPTIPGSSDDGLDSMGSISTTEQGTDDVQHPLSQSWHGTSHDQIDLVLEDYEIIPLDCITHLGYDDLEDFNNEGFVDLNPELRYGEGHRFDF